MQWTDPAWLAEATAWIDEHARRTGKIEQKHVRPWSTALRVPTDDGALWFKATVDAVAHEAAVIELLAERAPTSVPELVAVDAERAWTLMHDGGLLLRQVIEREQSLERWLEVLPRYAELQRTAAPDVDRFLERGVPDRRLATLPRQFDELLDRSDVPSGLRELSPRVLALCDQLAAVGIPETIQHDDLHDGQVLLRDSSYVIFDWGDSCVSHPFFTMSVTLEGVIAWGLDDVEDSVDLRPFRDAYLEPFTAMASKPDLDAALDAALRLGWICRSLTVDLLAASLNGAEREEQLAGLGRRLEMFAG